MLGLRSKVLGYVKNWILFFPLLSKRTESTPETTFLRLPVYSISSTESCTEKLFPAEPRDRRPEAGSPSFRF